MVGWGKMTWVLPKNRKKTAGNKPVMDSTFIISRLFLKKSSVATVSSTPEVWMVFLVQRQGQCSVIHLPPPGLTHHLNTPT